MSAVGIPTIGEVYSSNSIVNTLNYGAKGYFIAPQRSALSFTTAETTLLIGTELP